MKIATIITTITLSMASIEDPTVGSTAEPQDLGTIECCDNSAGYVNTLQCLPPISYTLFGETKTYCPTGTVATLCVDFKETADGNWGFCDNSLY